jgi:hypothetical protein
VLQQILGVKHKQAHRFFGKLRRVMAARRASWASLSLRVRRREEMVEKKEARGRGVDRFSSILI